MPLPYRTGTYYIIEHPTKGILREIGEVNNQPVLRYSRTRRNSPKVMRFPYLPNAVKLCDDLRATSAKDANRLQIRKAPRFQFRCWECGRWIETKTGYELGHYRNCPMIGEGD